ncbi:hypothetical protein [Rhodovarius lipocyclicus]|uniref:hypothetical protein n=1 Tax=Rhodovarius lipocyclicus TaxID=268410 RepID=UPI00135696A4|nr:hypothetical protein [Rhodovarius lipocyclicus]
MPRQGPASIRIVDEALFLFVAHDPNPRAMSRRVKGFVRPRFWSQDLAPISMG